MTGYPLFAAYLSVYCADGAVGDVLFYRRKRVPRDSGWSGPRVRLPWNDMISITQSSGHGARAVVNVASRIRLGAPQSLGLEPWVFAILAGAYRTATRTRPSGAATTRTEATGGRRMYLRRASRPLSSSAPARVAA